MHRSAGTSLNYFFLKINKTNKYKIIRFGHSIKPRNVNFSNKNKYIFNVRNPLDLLCSAFNQDKKKEINRISKYNIKFLSLNFLAENLSSNNYEMKRTAIKALGSLKSFNYRLSNFVNINYLIKKPPFHIFNYKDLNSDYQDFCKKISYKKKTKIRVVFKSLKTNNSNKIKLSKLAIKNLKKYLANDIKIFNYIIKNKKKINSL
tara:strand:- start:443 stop:1054 length:612 start_codon:yes stop_codon:yes gene_type:complete